MNKFTVVGWNSQKRKKIGSLLFICHVFVGEYYGYLNKMVIVLFVWITLKEMYVHVLTNWNYQPHFVKKYSHYFKKSLRLTLIN